MKIRKDANSSTKVSKNSETSENIAMNCASVDNAEIDNEAIDSAALEGALVRKKSKRCKAGFNFWIDVLALLTFLISAISGLALMHPGSHSLAIGSPTGDALLGLSRFEWQHLHTQFSLIFVALVAIHLIMHRRWFASKLSRRMTSKI